MLRKLLITVAILVSIALGGAGGTAQAGAGSNSHNYISAKRAICHYFGTYCEQAMEVTACESGHTWSVWAKNGQYLGMFQMGSHERAKYGHGNNVWAQAKAAWAYFVDSGKDWSPWQCKPY